MDSSNKVTYIYLTHPLMIKHVKERPNVVEYVKKQLGEDWKAFGTNFEPFWYNFLYQIDLEEDEESTGGLSNEKLIGITTGVCIQQYKEMEEGGVYINPFLIGLLNSFDEWYNFIKENFGYNTIFKELYIPYEYFAEVFEEYKEDVQEKIKKGEIDADEIDIPEVMTEEDYNHFYEHVKTIVDSLNVAVSTPKEIDPSQTPHIVGNA